MQWREVDGYDWCVIETPETGPYLSLVLGYGLVHEPVEDFGTLQLAAGMLQTELSRPVETGFGRASVPEVSVNVGSDTTTISMRGDVPTLSAAWRRLAEVLAGEHPLDIAEPVDVNIPAAPRDVTTRFGLTSLTLAASQVVRPQSAGDPFMLLGRLNPAAGEVRAVMCTNTEQLISSAFAPPAGGLSGPERSRYRADARPGGMEFRAGYPLISVMVPSSADGAAAVRVLAQQTVQHIHDVTRRDLGVEVSFVSVGPDTLATLMVADVILYGHQRSQIQQLIASKPIPDHRIAEAVEFEVDNRPLGRILARRVHSLDDEFASLEATHQALAQARATMRFYTDPHSLLPAGYEPIDHALPAADGPKFKRKAGRDTLVIGADIIEHRHDGGRGVSLVEAVDAQNLALVIEDPSDGLVLIDDQYRTVDVIFDVYRKQADLRDLIAQRTMDVPRITAGNLIPAAEIRQQVGQARKIKWAVGLAPVAIIGFAVIMSWADNSREVGEPAPEHTNQPQALAEDEPERAAEQVKTAAGQTATLPNWSRVTVNVTEFEPDQDSEFASIDGMHLVADIEYCASEDDDFVDPDRFSMTYGDPSRFPHDLEVEDPLQPQELKTGQCATGQLGYFVMDEDPVNMMVTYSYDYPGRVTWVVEDIESAS